MAKKNRSSRLLASPSRFAEKHSPRVESPSPRSAMKRVVRAFELHALDRPDARSFQPRVEDSIASESRDGERRGVALASSDTRRARLSVVISRRRRAMHDDGRRVCLRAFERASATFEFSAATVHARIVVRRFSSRRLSSFASGVGDARGAFQKRTGPPRKRGFQTRASSVFAREVSPLASVPLDVRDVAPPSEREPS